MLQQVHCALGVLGIYSNKQSQYSMKTNYSKKHGYWNLIQDSNAPAIGSSKVSFAP